MCTGQPIGTIPPDLTHTTIPFAEIAETRQKTLTHGSEVLAWDFENLRETSDCKVGELHLLLGESCCPLAVLSGLDSIPLVLP